MTIGPSERIVIRNLNDDELRHESKKMWTLASYAHGMATKIDQELKRRKKVRRLAIQESRG